MLNWDKIDNEKVFQRLVNNLFALECNSPGFIPSSPYIGADGAWDGYFKGYYTYEKQDGVWSIQSKWTTKSFKNAIPFLRKSIKREFENAKSNNVQHLRIATNAELKVDQVISLEALAKDEFATLRVWHREELTRRIELQPFLRSYFFGLPQHPKFAPWNLYFEQTEKDLLPLPAIKIDKFKDYINKVLEFLRLGGNILLIHSPGGYGKSHLLRDIAQTAHDMDRERQAWMTRQGYRTVEEAIQHEIIEGRNYLLILDDADRFLEEARPLIAFAKHKAGSVKLILALRTSGLRPIYEIVRELRCEEIYDEMSISDWSRNDLVRLLRVVTEQERLEDEEILAALYPNPYLIVWIGKQIRKEPSVDFKKVKEKFVNDVEYESERCLKDVFSASEIKEFVTDLACIAPFSIKDETLLGTLGKKFGKRTETIMEKIDALSQAGILRVVGNSLRFNPDIRGDIYLAYNIEKADFTKLSKLVQSWLPLCAEKLFINFEGAARYGDVLALEKIFSGIVDSWIKEAARTPRFVRDERLKLAEKVTIMAPKSCLKLMYSYLHSDAPAPEDEYLKSLDSGMKLTTDDYGPVIIKLFGIPDIRKEIFQLIEEIHGKKMEGIYDTYKPLRLAQDSVSPLHKSAKAVLDTLDIFLEWLEKPNQSRIGLISAGLSEVLAGSHEYTKSTIGGIVLGDKVLEATKEVIQTRDNAMDVLKNMIRDPSLEVKLAAIEVAEEIGSTRRGIGPRSGIPLSDRIAQDRAAASEQIAKLVSPEADFHLLNAIENLFIRWWALEVPGTKKVTDYLRKFPRSIEYTVFRYFASPDYVVRDFEYVERQALDKDRWGWFVDNIMHNENYSKPEHFKPEVEELIRKYDSEEKTAVFLTELHEKISRYDRWPRPQIIRCWVHLDQKKFFSIRENKELWEKIPEKFRNEIDLAISELDKEFTKKLAEEVLSELPDTPPSKVDTLLTMFGRYEVEEKDLENCVTTIVGNGSKEHRSLVVFHLDSVFERNKNTRLLLELLHKAVSWDEELNSRMMDSFSFAIHKLQKHSEKVDKGLLDKIKDELLRKLKDVPELTWRADELLGFSLRGIESAIGFIEYRLQKSKEIREKDKRGRIFKAIPYGGLKCVSGQIKSFTNFEKFMEAFLHWHKEDTPYRRFYLEYLMEPIKNLTGKDSKKLFLEEYLDKQIEENYVEKAIMAAEYLPLSENTITMLVRVTEKGIEIGASKDVERLLFGKSFPKGGWSGKTGEPPPALVKIKNTFEKMREIAKSGELRIIIGKCIEILDSEIKDDLRRDEEFLTPRG